MSYKVKFQRVEAMKVARFLCLKMADVCVRLVCAGSLRRGKEMVGDVEILFIPEFETIALDLLYQKKMSKVDVLLDQLIAAGILVKRKNVNGSEMWGAKNKLAVHVVSGIPVDFFTATEENWFNYLVCRTGGAENNVEIASAAQRKGWKWNPYGAGFTDRDGNIVSVKSEQEVYALAGLPFREPKDRG